jgi:hypothetical protein
MLSPATLVIVIAIVAAVWFWFRSEGGQPPRGAEARLRGICLGNEEQVERLIHAEMARAPGISRNEAAAGAVSRYQRDNR